MAKSEVIPQPEFHDGPEQGPYLPLDRDTMMQASQAIRPQEVQEIHQLTKHRESVENTYYHSQLAMDADLNNIQRGIDMVRGRYRRRHSKQRGRYNA